jgi:hypothetical protein
MKESCCAGEIGTDLTVGEAISPPLCDYVVEDKADVIVVRLGIERLQVPAPKARRERGSDSVLGAR